MIKHHYSLYKKGSYLLMNPSATSSYGYTINVHQFDPSTPLDEDMTTCFMFAGDQGGAILVSNSNKYHIM